MIAEEMSNSDVVERYVGEVIIKHHRIEVEVRTKEDREEAGFERTIQVPFSPTVTAYKGITREAAKNDQIKEVAREKLLNAIRRASQWVDAIRSGKAESFDEIAAREGLGERHVRWLSPLAFLSPDLVKAILDELAPAGLSVARLAKALPHSWAEQNEIHG